MEDDGDGREYRAHLECVSLLSPFPSLPLPDQASDHAVNCWPSADAGSTTVNLEYELENTALSLHNVVISIPLPPGAEPTISEAPAHGSYAVNPHTANLEWMIDEVSEAAGTGSGSLEFEYEAEDTDACFPVEVDFVSQKGICGVEVRCRMLRLPPLWTMTDLASASLQVLGVTNPADGDSAVDYSLDSLLGVDRYEVV